MPLSVCVYLIYLSQIHINLIGLQFEHIFVVGLPSRSDRRDGMVLGAGLTGIKIEFIDGISGSDIAEKAIPLPQEGKAIEGGGLGAWRAHINAIRESVARLLDSLF